MKTIIQTTVLLLSIGASLLFANPIERNTDRPGGDYNNLGNLRDATVCQRKCQEDNRCLAWTFVKANTIYGPDSYSECYLKDSVPQKRTHTSCESGVITRQTTLDDVKTYIAANGYFVKFNKNSGILDSSYDFNNPRHYRIKEIITLINQQGHTKLYISIKNKSAGLANKRVKMMKEYLARYGLTPRKYHVQKVSKNDKKRGWLSQNNHLWMRVESIR